ncbi:MAG: methyltransferase type 11, partial [Proteobacteria bacterium]|nr:methyltransferase type 11 [Pseudomonadota bacterium]
GSTTAFCEEGHYVCDDCHRGDGLELITRICRSSTETDMIALLQKIRRAPAIKMHGPEHHALVPAVMVATYRALGGDVADGQLEAAISRGAKVPGGFCGFAGGCGAALGVGIAFAVLLGSTPVKARERQLVLRVTAAVTEELSKYKAGRCCQRDCWIALTKAAELSHEILPLPLRAEAPYVCEQFHLNKQCIHRRCPLYPPKVQKTI